MFDDNNDDDDDEPDLNDLLMEQCGGKIKTQRLVGLDTESKIGAIWLHKSCHSLLMMRRTTITGHPLQIWLSLYQPLMTMCLKSRSLFLMLEALPPKPR